MQHDIRWQQRFANYAKAFQILKEAVEQEELNELERNGLIRRFEFTLDLSWKVMKDYLQEKGFAFKPTPKDTLRLAQQLSHDYSGEKFTRSERTLREEVFPALKNLYDFFEGELKQ